MRAQRKILASLAVMLAATAVGQAQNAVKPAAVVNGEAITLAELDQAVKLMTGGQPPPTPLTQQQKRQQQLEMLCALIDNQLMEQFLRQNGPKVDPAEVDKQLTAMVDNLKKQNKSFPDMLKESGQTEADVRRNLTQMLQWEAFLKTRCTDAEISKYYVENKDFFDQVKVRASHILVQVAADAPDAVKQQARQKLSELRQQIVAGSVDFAAAAKQHSQCPSGAQAGGDINYFTRKWMMDESFAKAAFAMKVGEISEPVLTDFGYHLIKITDRQAGQPSDFEKIKDEVKEIFMEDLRLLVINQYRKASKIEVNLP